MRANEFINEAALGTNPARTKRQGSRPPRGHEPQTGYKINDQITDAVTSTQEEDIELDERGKASVKLCTSSIPDSKLGVSQLNSCKSQGLRARSGKVKYTIGKKRVPVEGKKIKGKDYGGPLPKWS